LIDLLADVNHNHLQRIRFQFKKLGNSGAPVDWPAVRDLVTRFPLSFSTQKVCDLFLDDIQANLSAVSVTSSAFQLLVDRGIFELVTTNLSDELVVANPDETAAS
jgi:hypothetical protein